jgi:hypothetical protein
MVECKSSDALSMVAVLFAQQLAAPTLEKIKNGALSMGGVLFVLPRALQMQTS